MPDLKDIHINEPLTNLSLEYHPEGFIVRELFPVFNVAKETDIFFKYGKEGMYRYKGGLRAPGAPSVEVEYDVTTDSYICHEYAFSHPIPKRIRDNADKPLNPDKDAMYMLTDLIFTDEELKGNAVAINSTTGLYKAGYFTTPAIKWDAANAIIVKDVETAKEKIRSRIFKDANVMIIPQKVINAMIMDADILDRIKYTQKGIITPDILSSLFGLKVVVAYSGYLSDADVHSYILGENVILAYVAPRPGLKTVSFAYTFMTRDKRVRKWFSDEREADLIEVSSVFGQEIICLDAGYCLKAVLT